MQLAQALWNTPRDYEKMLPRSSPRNVGVTKNNQRPWEQYIAHGKYTEWW